MDDNKNQKTDKVFEFTPDLNISPIKNADQSPGIKPIPDSEKPNTPLQEAIGRLNISPKLREQLSGVKTPSNASTSSMYREKIEGTPPTPSMPPAPSTPPTPSMPPAPSVPSTPPTPSVEQKNEVVAEIKKKDSGQIVLDENGQVVTEKKPREPDLEKAIRTYEGDVAEALARKNPSAASIFSAEQKRQEERMRKSGPENNPDSNTSSNIRMGRVDATPVNLAKDAFINMEPSRFEGAKVGPETPEIPPMPSTSEPFETRSTPPVPPPPVLKTRAESPTPPTPPVPPVPPVPPTSPIPTIAPLTMQEATPPPPTDEKNYHSSSKNMIILLIAGIFILGGIAGAYFLYSKSPIATINKNEPVVPNPNPVITNDIIKSEENITVDITSLSPNKIIEKIVEESNRDLEQGKIRNINLIESKNGTMKPITSSELLKLLGIKAPDILTRSLKSDWMLGVYKDSRGNQDLFIIAKQNFFQNSFAGMLSWENSIINDIKQFAFPNLSSSASTTNITLRGKFVDGLVRSKDVREYKTENGTVILLYSFIDQEKIVITSKELALEEIIKRLDEKAFMR